MSSSGTDSTATESTETKGTESQLAPVTWLFGGSPPQLAVPEELSSPSASTPQPPTTVAREQVREPGLSRDGFERISTVSMNALTRRGMSAEEMGDYLASREFDEGDIELECERLLGVGLLDDVALAETLVRTLRERKGLGKSALTAELRRRKLDSDAIAEALEELDTDDELGRATEIALKRAPQLRSLDRATAQRRLGAFLMRKGYSGSVISAAVSAALSPSGASSSGPVFR